MFSIPSTPAKQSVGDTIAVLSGRLGSATLLEDRRAAILGLRSFAKDFPASVASSALRSLISCLVKDREDVDTVKLVLETLLMLFDPNEQSPEASDEIVLWLADEFTQRQENITLLLDLLDSADFYFRIYSLQLLGAIHLARTERTEECIFIAPLSIGRLVSILDDQREAIRNECISLLISLTPTATDIQKLVAFENAFEKIFVIIDAEGRLAEGGRTVEDCLILLANLLRRNTSNRSLFRESGCITRAATLLRQLLELWDQEVGDFASWAEAQRNRNIYAFLNVIRLFLQPGSAGTAQNQDVCWKQELTMLVLQLAFSPETQVQIKAEALITCGDMIRNNRSLQEGFAGLLVQSPVVLGQDMLSSKATKLAETYVIDGLLDLTLNLHRQSIFDVRYAACELLKAYFFNHTEVKLHFLRRAIEGFEAERQETANVLSVILTPKVDLSTSDPYREWFAAVITFHLLYENPAAKSLARSITEGDTTKDEEVVTSIQTVVAHLLSRIRREDDERVIVAYLMLLIGWLFEDLDAVNDILADGSNIQALIQVISQPMHIEIGLIHGLCAMLLSFIYEFSTKDSPISRMKLHSILESKLDRESYLDRLAKLRSHPLLREFEIAEQKLVSTQAGEQVNVYFDQTFVDFFKDNYSRARRAFDRAPDIEVSVINDGQELGISRELVDALRAQTKEKERVIDALTMDNLSLGMKFKQERESHQLTKDTALTESTKAQNERENLEKFHKSKLENIREQQSSNTASYEKRLAEIKHALSTQNEVHQTQIDHMKKTFHSETDRLQSRSDAEIADLRATISRLEAEIVKVEKNKTNAIKSLQRSNESELEKYTIRFTDSEAQSQKLGEELGTLYKELAQLKESTESANMAKTQALLKQKATQSELDDLLIVFGDLEEKVSKYKIRLQKLGQDISDAENDTSEGEEVDDDEGSDSDSDNGKIEN